MQRELNILYEDKEILVCIKPAGVATETKRTSQQDMVSLLRNYRSQKGEDLYIGVVHRLDQPVEGILVFGKNTKSTSALSMQLAQGFFSKIYLAVTLGDMSVRQGKLQDYLKKDSHTNTSYVTSADDPKAKKAVLLYEVIETDFGEQPGRNLVKIELLTGRHHQIRVQMAKQGTPLEGDRKYGGGQMSFGHLLDGQLKLCACELGFAHPVTKKKMEFRIRPSWQEMSEKIEASDT